jgi:hypothetical protein
MLSFFTLFSFLSFFPSQLYIRIIHALSFAFCYLMILQYGTMFEYA